MEANYCALLIAIFSGCSPEAAFRKYYMEKRKLPTKEEKQSDFEEMFALKEAGKTYEQIGEIFGLNKCTVYRRMCNALGGEKPTKVIKKLKNKEAVN